MKKFKNILSDELLRSMEELNYTSPTEIQEKAIPVIFEGRDVLGQSQTGTGKTAAFGIPVVEMATPNNKRCETLIICPTRELVMQITDELRKYAKYKHGVKVVSVYGGQPINTQIRNLQKGYGIVVGTPGRIMDHLRRKTIRLSSLKRIVLDEADEMLNMGFEEDIKTILKSIPHEDFQTLLFSATMPQSIFDLTKEYQNDPFQIKIKPNKKALNSIDQQYYDISKNQKMMTLNLILEKHNPNLAIIFANTKKRVDKLVTDLNNSNINAVGLHGDMRQNQRTKVIRDYKKGKYTVLVATDVAARGIDVDDVELVINYDVPRDNEYYIHRIGRTGRAGKEGMSITLVTGRSELKDLKFIERNTKSNITLQDFPNRKTNLDKGNSSSKKQETNKKENRNDNLEQKNSKKNSKKDSMSNSHKTFDDNENFNFDKKSKNNSDSMTKLKINIGTRCRITAKHITSAVSQASGLRSNVIGKISVLDKITLFEVESKYSDRVLDSMIDVKINGFDTKTILDRTTRNDSKNKKNQGNRNNQEKRHGKNKRTSQKNRYGQEQRYSDEKRKGDKDKKRSHSSKRNSQSKTHKSKKRNSRSKAS